MWRVWGGVEVGELSLMTRTLISIRLIISCSCPHFSMKLRLRGSLSLFIHIEIIFGEMEYQCGGHLREYDSSIDCLCLFFDFRLWAVAWAWAGPEPAWSLAKSSGLDIVKPEPLKAGPQPWLSGQAGPAHHYSQSPLSRFHTSSYSWEHKNDTLPIR